MPGSLARQARAAPVLLVLWLILGSPPGAAGQAPAPQAPAPQAPTTGDPLARGDAAYERRAAGHRGGQAAPGPIEEAIAAYEAAVRQRPADLTARWKLLRALYFKGEHVATTQDAKRAVFDRGRQAAEQGLDQLAAKVGGRKRLDSLPPAELAKALTGAGLPVDQTVPLFLWSGVHWGLWGDAFGKLAAARQGVGDKIRRYGEVGTAIDDRYDDGAAHRLLGRLHALAPKVPLVTGWVDRRTAIAELRRAVEVGPDEPLNHLYLAEALLEHQPAKKAEALQILRRVAERAPSPARVVENEKARATARALLAKNGG
jgi:tetratricopeptide (TPR) repeat protein